MKDYKRLTKRYGDIVSYAKPLQSNFIGAIYEEQKERDGEIINRLADLEDKIESGELCERKEMAREILSEIESYVKTVFKSNTPKTATLHDCIMSAKISALRKEYGVEPFGNSDKLEDEE